MTGLMEFLGLAPKQGAGLMNGVENRGSILPIARDMATQQPVLAWPQAALDAWGAAQLPGRVYEGHKPTMEEIGNLAMTMTGGGLMGSAPAGALRSGPIRAYHGAKTEFAEFDKQRAGQTDEGFLGRGFYLSTDPNIGRSDNMTLAFDLDIENPLRLDMPKWSADKKSLVRRALGISESASAKDVSRSLRESGYDAVMLDYSPLGYFHKEIMVPEASQAKAKGRK